GRVSLGRGLQALAAPALGLAAPLASLALYASEPVGAALRRALLAQVPTGRRSLARLAEAIERLGLRWDGRVRIAAVDLQSGRRGARVTVVNPDERSRAAMGADLLDPRPRAAVAAAGLQQGQRMGAGLAA